MNAELQITAYMDELESSRFGYPIAINSCLLLRFPIISSTSGLTMSYFALDSFNKDHIQLTIFILYAC